MTSLDFFIPSEYKDGKGETRNCYFLTKKGCEMVANKLTGEKGILFTAQYVNRFAEMEKKQKIPTTDREILMLSVKVQEQTAQRVDKLEEKFETLESSLTIDHGQQQKLQMLCKSRVISLLGGKNTSAYKLYSKQLFSSIWGDFKQYFNIASYRDCLVTDFEDAKKYLVSYNPSNNIVLAIRKANNQTSLDI
ncbi:phage regulatory protein [Coprobacillus sp. AF15-30]|nr:phage regulatory protein [Coprobacillus sp. AF15-30]